MSAVCGLSGRGELQARSQREVCIGPERYKRDTRMFWEFLP